MNGDLSNNIKPKKYNHIKLYGVILAIAFILISIFIIILLKNAFVKNQDYGVPYYVNSSLANEYFLDGKDIKFNNSDIKWKGTAEKADPSIKPFNQIDTINFEYYLVGESATNTDKYYISKESSSMGAAGNYLFSVSNDKVTIFSLHSPDFQKYRGDSDEYQINLIDIEPGIVNSEVTTINNDTILNSTSPPKNIDIGLIRLSYENFAEWPSQYFMEPPKSSPSAKYDLIKSLDVGDLYSIRYISTIDNNEEVRYILKLKNHVNILYKPTNDYNTKEYIDNIKWRDNKDNQSPYVPGLSSVKCEDITKNSPYSRSLIYYDLDNSLKPAGKYPDDTKVYTSDRFNNYIYKHLYKNDNRREILLSNTQAGLSYEDFVEKKPTYLIDSGLGYYFVYYNSDLIRERDNYNCR